MVIWTRWDTFWPHLQTYRFTMSVCQSVHLEFLCTHFFSWFWRFITIRTTKFLVRVHFEGHRSMVTYCKLLWLQFLNTKKMDMDLTYTIGTTYKSSVWIGLHLGDQRSKVRVTALCIYNSCLYNLTCSCATLLQKHIFLLIFKSGCNFYSVGHSVIHPCRSVHPTVWTSYGEGRGISMKFLNFVHIHV